MTSFSANGRLNTFDERIRKIERGLEKSELREKQLIIMFKMILDASFNPDRAKTKRIGVKDIIGFMESIVSKNLEPEEKRESPDLISEMIKKSH